MALQDLAEAEDRVRGWLSRAVKKTRGTVPTNFDWMPFLDATLGAAKATKLLPEVEKRAQRRSHH